MLTECPACMTVFRVTPAILKMGRGQVRCGKCRQQFDAVECLLEEDAQPSEAPAPARTMPAADEQPHPEIGEEITMEGERVEVSGRFHVGDAADDDAGEADDELENESQSDDPDVEMEIDVDDPPIEDVAPAEDESDTESLRQRLWQRVTHPKQAQAREQIAAELDALTQPPPPAQTKRIWTIATIALAVMLVAQLIHHNRDGLVRSPQWGGSITRLYRALGLSLDPNWDLHGYELQQWGMVSDTGSRDALRLRASIANKATFDQPYPYIRLLMTDRWGAAVAARDFSPQEYLPAEAADRMMAPRQRANAEIVFVDPGADAVNFDVDPCVPAHAQPGQLLCRKDVPVIK